PGRGLGVQWFRSGGAQLLVFAVHTGNRWSNAATNAFDIAVDVDGGGDADYINVGVDFGSFFFASRRRHTRSKRDWSSDVCSSDLTLCGDFSKRVVSGVTGIPSCRREDLPCVDQALLPRYY